ncbi:MAG: 50S ribosomal protein L4 [Candidatus Omnitrophota bacterium]|jgi:large subunit ribosomal protein L4
MKENSTRLQVYDLKGEAAGNIQLDQKIFDGTVNMELLYEVEKMYQANRRKGAASTKTRSEVSGGGAKPWRQKGTGRARFGSSRNPIWRHGGVAFGPKPRDFSYSIPKKALRKALLSSLNLRLTENMIKPVVKIEVKEAKTKEFKTIMNKLKIEGKVLVVVDVMDEGVKRSSRNIREVSLKEGRNINAEDVMLNDYLVIEKEALEKLSERLK